jgi:hypothetical protein
MARHDDVVSLCAAAMRRSSTGYKHIRHDPGAISSLTRRTRRTVPSIIYNTTLCPDIVSIDRTDPPLGRNEQLEARTPYTIRLHDVCVVSSEERSEIERNSKNDKYATLVAILKSLSHTAKFFAVCIGSRVPVPSIEDLVTLECDNLQTLRTRIWHCVVRHLRIIHLAHKRAQNIDNTASNNPAIPRQARRGGGGPET